MTVLLLLEEHGQVERVAPLSLTKTSRQIMYGVMIDNYICCVIVTMCELLLAGRVREFS